MHLTFLQRIHIAMLTAVIAMDCLSVCLSICTYITFRCVVEMNEGMIERFSASGRKIIQHSVHLSLVYHLSLVVCQFFSEVKRWSLVYRWRMILIGSAMRRTSRSWWRASRISDGVSASLMTVQDVDKWYAYSEMYCHGAGNLYTGYHYFHF